MRSLATDHTLLYYNENTRKTAAFRKKPYNSLSKVFRHTIDVMGEPLVIVRGTDGIVRALNTACRHRAMPVVTGRAPHSSWART